MPEMIRTYDDITAYWGTRCPLPIASSAPLPQYDGRNYHPWEGKWQQHILKNRFPEYCRSTERIGTLECSPYNIIKCFQDRNVLEALVLIIGWGSLTQTKEKIFRSSRKEIEATLLECLKFTQEQNSVEASWNLLVGNFNWNHVIISKTLHFLARSLGYETNPPVPIDKKVILDEVWPAFRKQVKHEQGSSLDAMPSGWWDRSSSWESYNRYMTAINCWAEKKDWTTTQIENTIYQEYHPGR